MIPESQNYKELKAHLRDMFQMDQPDLDFGIYRIMNQKREEIEKFLDNGKDIFRLYRNLSLLHFFYFLFKKSFVFLVILCQMICHWT